MIGRTIAHCTVTEKIGQGGMGEVSRATDTKLKRDVALKILPDSFTQDPQRMARFTREAQVLASVNHPNIGGIYGLEEEDGVRALALGTGVSCADPVQFLDSLKAKKSQLPPIACLHASAAPGSGELFDSGGSFPLYCARCFWPLLRNSFNTRCVVANTVVSPGSGPVEETLERWFSWMDLNPRT